MTIREYRKCSLVRLLRADQEQRFEIGFAATGYREGPHHGYGLKITSCRDTRAVRPRRRPDSLACWSDTSERPDLKKPSISVDKTCARRGIFYLKHVMVFIGVLRNPFTAK